MKAKETIKAVFEQSREGIKSLGIDAGILTPVMSELVADYATAGDFSLALVAAKVTGESNDFRVVFEAMKGSQSGTNRVGIAGMMEIFGQQEDFFQALVGVGNEADMREYAAIAGEDRALKIFSLLKDAESLMA